MLLAVIAHTQHASTEGLSPDDLVLNGFSLRFIQSPAKRVWAELAAVST